MTWLTGDTRLLSQSSPVQGQRVQMCRGPGNSLEAREEQVLRLPHYCHRDRALSTGLAVVLLQSLGRAEGLLGATEVWPGGSTWCHQLSSWSMLVRTGSCHHLLQADLHGYRCQGSPTSSGGLDPLQYLAGKSFSLPCDIGGSNPVPACHLSC